MGSPMSCAMGDAPMYVRVSLTEEPILAKRYALLGEPLKVVNGVVLPHSTSLESENARLREMVAAARAENARLLAMHNKASDSNCSDTASTADISDVDGCSSDACSSAGSTTCRVQDSVVSERTSVMLRNIPSRHTRSMILSLFDEHGFKGDYDMVYLPANHRNGYAFGYAFVNLVSTSAAERFISHFEGFRDWGYESEKICAVEWSSHQGGLEAHVERYRNSPVMHPSVRDEMKPVIFQDGQRIPFPAPTQLLERPRRGRKDQ